MASHDFLVDDVSLDDEDETTDQEWQAYCAEAAQVDRRRVLACVLSVLDDEQSPLYPMIDMALKCPHERGRARESLTVLASLGQELLNLIAACVDEQVNLRQMCGTRRGR